MVISDTSIVIMASGFSNRMKKNKLFLTYQGETFLTRALKLALKNSAFHEVLLVIKPEDLAKIEIPPKVKVVLNHESGLGQSTSVKLGASEASGKHLIFIPIDQPRLSSELLEKLAKQGDSQNIVYPIHNGNPSSPTFFGEKYIAELKEVSGQTGGRKIRDKYHDFTIEIPWSKEELFDIDTPENYQELLEKSNKVL
ncbi:nucleotidyltransferase family protein [Enterococcus sp. AZ103]|uniref:nucleotidyltransferase family protein n=1 Tax=Enterococcus sp. AZ103 TaxID=2774628 RepID=UPI003F20C7DD